MDDIRTITKDDAEYPELLLEIHDTPEQLFVRGAIPKGAMLAVVGTRLPTAYGKQVTPNLVERLARAGMIIVSGLAYGIDSLAHEAALAAGGLTVAVLGGGVDEKTLYPRKNLKLARRIVENGGAVISEYPAKTECKKHHFPARNRIVSGMSRSVLVIEAKEKSGALITARHATEQNRDVFAIPGPITSPYSVGPNMLIRDGATPTLSPADILDDYEILNTQSVLPETKNTTREEARILDVLIQGALNVDTIADNINTSVPDTLTLLTQMELKELIRNVSGGTYARC